MTHESSPPTAEPNEDREQDDLSAYDPDERVTDVFGERNARALARAMEQAGVRSSELQEIAKPFQISSFGEAVVARNRTSPGAMLVGLVILVVCVAVVAFGAGVLAAQNV